MKRFTIPGIFWRDHWERCSDHDGERNIIRDDGRLAIVELDAVAVDDLRSDAEYYADGVDFCGEKAAYRALINSARATVRAIDRQAAA